MMRLIIDRIRQDRRWKLRLDCGHPAFAPRCPDGDRWYCALCGRDD